MNFQECGRLYRHTEQLFEHGVTVHLVSFPQLGVFDKDRKGLASAVKHHSLSGIWEQAAKFFNIVHAKIARTPCSPSWLCNEIIRNMEADTLFRDIQARLNSVDGAVAKIFQKTVSSFEAIKLIENSPLLQPLSALAARYDSCLVVLRDPRLWEQARKALQLHLEAMKWDLAKPTILRNHNSVDRMILFGPPWYLVHNQEQFLLRAPVAGSVDMVVCTHEYSGAITASSLVENSTIPLNGGERVPDSVQLREFEPTPPAGTTQFRFKAHAATDLWSSDKKIVAIPFRLGGKFGTHLKQDGNVWVVEVDFTTGGRECIGVQKIPVEDLESGHLVIMTTGGGGDMIPLVADMILENSREIRDLQTEWKCKLRKIVEEEGYESTCQRLNALGCRRATPPNIRNWCNLSPRKIEIEDREADLKSVLNLVGLFERYEDVALGMDELARAHSSAGRQLQRKLLENLRGKDLGDLLRDGYLEVRDGDTGAAKTIFLVEERGAEEEIPEGLEGEIREIED